MERSRFVGVRSPFTLLITALLATFGLDATQARAETGVLADWEAFYSATPEVGQAAECQLCHVDDTGEPPFNGYGWAVFNAIADLDNCDSDVSGVVSNEEAFACIEDQDSDADPDGVDNIGEIQAGTQPGWTVGRNNTLYPTISAPIPNQPPPSEDIGLLDACPTGETIPESQFGDGTILVRPGQSIQEAIDRAEGPTVISIEPGVYREHCNPINGINITKDGIHLIGLSTVEAGPDSAPEERVIIESTGEQRNGIVIVPLQVPQAAQPKSGDVVRTNCMGCHYDMAPPFPLLPDVPRVVPKQDDPWLDDVIIQSITIQGYSNNGLFTEHVDGFVFDDVESIDNRNYGIFPVLSRNGVIRDSYSTGSDLDSALWVETSETVEVTGNLVENSVNGIEVSNSDDVTLTDNESRNNTVGAAILLLPDIYDNRDSAKRINMINNWLHDNNKENTARPGSILAEIPQGIGILYLGVDDSEVTGNLVERNDFAGIAVSDYCLPLLGTDFACTVDPVITDEFLEDEAAENNRVIGNELVDNATDPAGSFDQFAADLSLLTAEDRGNCFSNNDAATEYSFIGTLPECPDVPGEGGMGGGMGGSGGDGSGSDSGCSCVIGGPSPFRFSTTWLILVGALALMLRRRLRHR